MLCEASCTIGKMRIQKCLRQTVYFVAFVVLLLTTAAESKWDEDELLLNSLVYSGDINLETAELLGLNCKAELLNAKKTLQELNSHLLDETSSENDLSQTKKHEVVTALRLQVKQLLLDCLSVKRSTYAVSGEDKISDTWYNRYLGYYHHSSQRRKLAQAPVGSPAPSLTVPPPSPAPSITPASPPQSSFGFPFSPPLTIPGFNLQPPPDGIVRSSNASSNRQETTRRTVIIAVVVTAFVTFAVAAFFFFCWRRCRGYRHHGNDASDHKMFSVGATTLNDGNVASQSTNSKLSNYNGNVASQSTNSKLSNHNGNVASQSTNKLSNHNTNSGNYNMGSHSQSNSKSEIQVVKTSSNSLENFSALPPGIPSAHGMAPLKPPPGKTNSLEAIPAMPAPPPPPPAPKAPPPPPGPPPPPPMAAGPRPPPPPMMSGPRPPPPPMMSGPRPPPPPMMAGSRPPPPPMKGGPRPPPAPGIGGPPRPPPGGLKPPRPGVPSPSTSFEAGEAKTKLKPFFWDKVLANPDESMVWNQIKSGSFQFNEEMIETLFGVAPAVKNQNDTKKDSSHDPAPQFIKLIDPKKAQNLSILLRALNVTTEEVCDALEEGNELPAELIQTFLKMAPTTEEELKLRLYDGELSLLGPAERFLKVLVNIPFAFKRLESLHFMCILQEEQTMLKESFAVLEAACTELRKSRLFLKLLEAVLKTGNRMNDGTFRGGAQAFKLDTLLKLSDVKGTDGKTTLLHFVVQEITISEGVRAARAAKASQSMSSIKSDDLNDDSTPDTSDENLRAMGLQVISGVGDELVNVRKAAVLDSDTLTGTVARLGHALIKSRDFLNSDMKNIEEDKGFVQVLKSFVQNAEVDVMSLLEEEKRIMLLVKSTADYFHGHAGKDEGLRLFVIVRDFLIILEKVCREVKNAPRKVTKVQKKEDPVATSSESNRGSRIDPREKLFPAIADRRVDSSSSDDES